MPAQRVAIRKSFVILCEGAHDREFFTNLLEVRGIPHFDVWSNWELARQHGNTGFKRSLDALTAVRPGFDNVQAVLIATDSDLDHEAAFRNVVKQVEATADVIGPPERRYPIPLQPLAVAPGNPSLAVMLIPWLGVSGNLETLCMDAASDAHSNLTKCLDEFATCTGAHTWPITKLGKMKVRSFMSAANVDDPEISLSNLWKTDAKRLIPLEGPTFNQVADYLLHFPVHVGRAVP